jgi:eukaryotic-like serine/threonine-protein kinase
MSRSTDRNLLFGLLALQNNFIDRDALVDAFHRWVGDRSTALGQILLDRGALSSSRHALLAGLVAEHISLHGGDAEKSLAALSSVGSVREDLARIADPELHASLAQVSAARRDEDSDPFRTFGQASLGASTSAGSRFRILRPHAKGGLGQVSVALDQELDRPVALKEIQDRHADELDSRARFVQEAEITGKLEHPGIIPVYGLGHDATGRPFYAMRFIQGDSLKEAIASFHGDVELKMDPARRSTRLRELLRRFTDVCNAVAYAHSRGVLHRDLKPGNIMLGPYGETLVVDWGLAKPLGQTLETHGEQPATGSDRSSPSASTDGPIRLSGQSGSWAATVAGSPIGTPAFASPEQVLGKLDLLGPASDVYGLGATLYALLTGHAPAESEELAVVLRRVANGDIPAPRSIDSSIPRPLESICRKAMAVRMGDRYKSARAVADDVKRWMDDEPVSAYGDPIALRAARSVRKHPRLVTGVAAAVLVGVTALGIAYSRESSINRELRMAKNETDRRLDQTLQAVEDYYSGVGAEVLLGQQEFHDLRARLLEKPRQFYEQLSSELASSKAPDKRTRFLLARGRMRLGQIYRTLSRHDEARTQLESAIALLRESAALSPDGAVQASWAKSEYELGLVQLSRADYRASEASLRMAIEIWTSLAAAHPDTAAYAKGLADCFSGVGVLQHHAGDASGSVASYRQAIAIWAKLADSQPDVPEYLSGRALCAANLGLAQQETGDLAAAAKSLEQAIAIYDKLLVGKPDVPSYQNALAHAHVSLGTVRQATGELPRATESYRQAIATGIKLTAAQPNVLLYRETLADSYGYLGFVQVHTGDLTGAVGSLQQAVTIYTTMTAAHPDIPIYQRGLAVSFKGLGDAQRNLSDTKGTVESYRRSIAIYIKLKPSERSIPNLLEGLADSYSGLGIVQVATRDYAGAALSYRDALSIRDGLVKAHPEVPRNHFLLADILNEFGQLHRGSGRLDPARESYERAGTILERLVKEHPQVLEYKKLFAGVLTNIGLVDMAQGRRLDALRRFQQALTYWKEPFAKNPKDPFYSSGLKEGPKVLSEILGPKKSQEPAVPSSPAPGAASKKP